MRFWILLTMLSVVSILSTNATNATKPTRRQRPTRAPTHSGDGRPVGPPPPYNPNHHHEPAPYYPGEHEHNEKPPAYKECNPQACRRCGVDRDRCGHPQNSQSRLSRFCIGLFECCCAPILD
ncbi:hypothetical protein TKK_0005497 [Trichogramma kaykai]